MSAVQAGYPSPGAAVALLLAFLYSITQYVSVGLLIYILLLVSVCLSVILSDLQRFE